MHNHFAHTQQTIEYIQDLYPMNYDNQVSNGVDTLLTPQSHT